jgi:hypothetical protein
MGLTILRLIILRFASGWVLILLSLNFNRVAIVELNAIAVVVTSLLALQFFLAPLQAVLGDCPTPIRCLVIAVARPWCWLPC